MIDQSCCSSEANGETKPWWLAAGSWLAAKQKTGACFLATLPSFSCHLIHLLHFLRQEMPKHAQSRSIATG